MKPIYRRLRREEVPIAANVFLVSLAELAHRNGLPAPTSYTPASVIPAYEHLLETGIFEVAELEGKIVGIAAAAVRDSIWFLAMFWVLPEHKLQGIGRPLLERVQRLGEEQGATVRCVWSSVDFAAIASYLKLGMMPQGPIFTFAGPLAKPPAAHPEARLSALDSEQASAIDRVVRGTARELDHAFWRARSVPAYQLEIERRVAGYFYVKDGVIGPAAWLQPADGDALLSHALQQASAQAPEVKLVALGSNPTAIQKATVAGLRLVSASHFLSSAAFGKLDCYLPSGPALFWSRARRGLASGTGSGTGPVVEERNAGHAPAQPGNQDSNSMKRTLQCAFAAAALLASSSAWAQTFGEKGQIAISAERLFGFTYDSARVTQNGQDSTGSVTHFSLLSSPVAIGAGGGGAVWAGYGSPRVAGDYFLINRLSLGAALGYAHWSLTTQPAGPGAVETTTTGDSFTFAPRVGYLFTFNDMIGLWPRAGFTYRSFSAGNQSGHDFALTLEAPFAFMLIPHVVFWAGPTLDLGLTGSQNNKLANGTTTSLDFNALEIGIQTGLVVYFGT